MRLLPRVLIFAALLCCLRAQSQDAPPPETPILTGAVPLAGEPFTGRFVAFFDRDLPKSVGASAVSFDSELEHEVSVKGNQLLVRTSEALQDQDIHTLTFASPLPAHTWHLSAVPAAIADIEIQEGKDDEPIYLVYRFTRAMDRSRALEWIKITNAAGTPLPARFADGSNNQFWRLEIPRPVQLPLTLSISGDALDATGKLSLGETRRVQWPSNDPFTLSEARWTRENHDDLVLLTFPYTVDSRSMEGRLNIYRKSDGSAIDFYGEKREKNSEHSFRLTSDVSNESELKVVLKPGVNSTDFHRLNEPIERSLKRQSLPLRVDWHDWSGGGTRGLTLRLGLNQVISADLLKPHLSFSPPAEIVEIQADDYDGIDITANFAIETQYIMTISAGLKDNAGLTVLSDPLIMNLNESPKIGGVEFGYDGKFYFPRRNAGPLEIQARNVENSTATLYRLFPNNITAAIQQVDNDRANWEFNETLAREVAKQELSFPPAKNVTHKSALNMPELVGDLRGVFSLQLSNGEYSYYSSKVIVWTDLGLLAHWTNSSLVTYVHDLFSLAPTPGARVTVFSRKNQLLGEATTDASGVARLSGFDTSLGEPAVVVAEAGEDYTFLELEPRSDDVTPFESGMPVFRERGYDGLIYADRNLYRPGELVHLRFITRTVEGAPAANVPLQLRIFSPRGTEILSTVVTMSEFGTAGYDWQTANDFLTGRYSIGLRVPDSEQSVAEYELNLEEFVPNRIEAHTTVPAGPLRIDETYELQVKAKHLFGAPAESLRAEMRVMLQPGTFAPAGWEGFTFSNDAPMEMETLSLGEAFTDAQGDAVFSLEFEQRPEYRMPLEATVRADVYELGGRGVSDVASVTVLPSQVLLGGAAALNEDGKSLDVQVAAVNAGGAPAELAEVSVILEKQRWSYHVRRFDDYNEPRWSTSWERVTASTAALSAGRGAIQLPLGDYGYYRLRIESAETSHFCTLLFYRYWRNIDLVTQARPSLLKLTTASPSYTVGDRVELRIESPFDGRAVVVLQGAKFHDVLSTEIREGAGTISFTAAPGLWPNVWAGVTVVHDAAAENPEVYPYSSFAMVNVPLVDPARKLAVSFQDLPAEIRPAQDFHVHLQVRDHIGGPVNAEVTLAAVDDGIHAILDYANPDPAAWFERGRSVEHRRAHYYDRVAYDFEAAQIGGDSLHRRLGKGHPQIDDNWIKPVALWSGVLRTDASGRATAVLNIPEFNGRLRLVAVAATATATGAADAEVFARRPYILRTTMPRFALPGDSFSARAVVHNTTAETGQVRIKWSASGTLSGSGERIVAIETKSDAEITADFHAAAAPGGGAIDWTLELLDASGNVMDSVSEHAALPVRPATTYRSAAEVIVLQPGESRELRNTEFEDSDQLSLGLEVTGNPVLRLRTVFDYLLEYPYGCLEQTVSRCFPLYVAFLANVADEALPKGVAIEQVIQSGIDRIFTLQTGDGGLAMWPGQNASYDYGSIYALHFLTIAQADARFTMPDGAYNKLQEHVRRIVEDAYDDSFSGRYRRAYAVYVLALGGSEWAVEQVSRFDEVPLPAASRYLLAAALALNTGDEARVRQYLEKAPVLEFNERTQGGVLNSAIRNTAVETLALLAIDPQGERVHERVQLLSRHLEAERYTTQETSFIATALALYAQQNMPAEGAVSGTVTSPAGQQEVTAGNVVRVDHEGGAASFTVSNNGQAPLFVHFKAAGIPLHPETGSVSNGMSVSRRFLTEKGEPVAEGAFIHGQAYLVDIEVTLDVDTQNLILVNRLPAGLEVVNPRLDPDSLSGLDLPGMVSPSYLEVRDDRVLAAFDSMGNGTHHLYNIVRAITPGTFIQPGVSGECMYDPFISGHGPLSSVTISPAP